MTREFIGPAIEVNGDRPLLAGPLADIARRLQFEVQHGRDAGQHSQVPLPGVTAAVLAAFRSNPHAN